MPEEGRAGPEREFEKRKEVGFGRTPSHPLAASLQDDVRPLAQPWLPGAKLTRSGKAWVGVGMGSESGRRAGGGRTTHRKMLRELAGHVDSRSEGSVAPSASCGVSRAGERKVGTPPSRLAPARTIFPTSTGCPLSIRLMHFPDRVQPSAWQLGALCQIQRPCGRVWRLGLPRVALLSFWTCPCLTQHASLYLFPK